MIARAIVSLIAWALAGFASAAAALAEPEDAACRVCHKQFAAIRAGKPARTIGCAGCHAALDGSVVPHKSAGTSAMGLSSTGSQSCLQCHQKAAYIKLRHGSLGAACTGCHSAHAPKHGKLLDDDTTAVCHTCHDRKGFAGRVTHKPVAKGDCTDCHEVHATEHAGLLLGGPGEDCLTCHARVKTGRHAGASSLTDHHPVGGEKTGVADPAHPGRPFQCISCHDPHKSDQRGLLRLGQREGLCQECHSK